MSYEKRLVDTRKQQQKQQQLVGAKGRYTGINKIDTYSHEESNTVVDVLLPRAQDPRFSKENT